jgi:hypothetical protein
MPEASARQITFYVLLRWWMRAMSVDVQVPVIMKGRMPTTATDEFFSGTACSNCRYSEMFLS